MFDLKIIAFAEEKMNGRYDYLIIHYYNNNFEWYKVNDMEIYNFKNAKLGNIYFNDNYISPFNVDEEVVDRIKSIMTDFVVVNNDNANYLKCKDCDEADIKAQATLNYLTLCYLQRFLSNYKKLSIVHRLRKTLHVKSL
jgi:hypothetical protein